MTKSKKLKESRNQQTFGLLQLKKEPRMPKW